MSARPRAHLDTDWYRPANEDPWRRPDNKVRFLVPFDPVVHDRYRFARLWDWEYRFEAYMPAPKRELGDHALPPCGKLG